MADRLGADLTLAQKQVASIIESFIELGVSVHDYPGTAEAQQGMMMNLNKNIERLNKLNQVATGSMDQMGVPLDVLQYIEDSRNPDVYTRDFLEAIRRSNQYQRGKIQGLNELKQVLGQKIAEEFPELSDVVDDIMQRTKGV